jgi:hypothetical protein
MLQHQQPSRCIECFRDKSLKPNPSSISEFKAPDEFLTQSMFLLMNLDEDLKSGNS